MKNNTLKPKQMAIDTLQSDRKLRDTNNLKFHS